jgi:hypothetical protein
MSSQVLYTVPRETLIYDVDFKGGSIEKVTDTYNLGDMLLGNSFEGNDKRAKETPLTFESGGMTLKVEQVPGVGDDDNPATRGFYVRLSVAVKKSLSLRAEVAFDTPSVTSTDPLQAFAVGLNFKTGNQNDHPEDLKTGPTCRFVKGIIKLNFVVNAQQEPPLSYKQYSEIASEPFVLRTRIYLAGDAELKVGVALPTSTGDLDPTVLGAPYDFAGFSVANQFASGSVASARFQYFRLWLTPAITVE